MKRLWLILFVFIGCSSKKEPAKKNNVVDYSKTTLSKTPSKNTYSLDAKKTKAIETPKQIVKKVENKAIYEKRVEYVTTDYDSRLLSSPDSQNMITRIPKNTKIEVLDSKNVQQGRMLNTWYKVTYKGKTGWTSAFNMKNPPQAVVTTVAEMRINYEKKLGEAPKNNPLSGKIPEIVKWFTDNKDIKKIKFEQWYEPYPIDKAWNARVDVTEDDVKKVYNFKVKKNKIKSFKVDLIK